MGPRQTYGHLAAWFVLNPMDHSFIQLSMQTFELLTGRWLFNPQGGPTWCLEDDHLAKMMELTAENFDDRILAKSRKRDEYFDKSGLYTISSRDNLTVLTFCSREVTAHQRTIPNNA
jgi:hypothetical protein